MSRSNLTKYCACNEKRLPCLILRTYKRHLQCAEQHVSPSNLTKYCACHAERLACLILIPCEMSFTMRGATGVTIQPHQILRPPRKMTLQNLKEKLRRHMKRHLQRGDDPSMIREWSEHETVSPQPASQPRLLVELSTSISFWKIQHFPPGYHSKIHQALHLPLKVTLELPQALNLPREPATRTCIPTSPSALPDTQNDSLA